MTSKIPHFDETASRIEIPVGSRFEIELPAATTAGYLWEMASEPAGVELIGDHFQVASQQPGASATQRLTFRAVKKGKEQITLRYGRPQQDAANVFHPTIVVQ